MRWRPLAAIGLVATAAACVGRGGAAGATNVQSIVEGDAAPEQAAVVLVTNAQSGAFCSGTVIAPRVVLTAKHCVQASGDSAPAAPSTLAVGFGTSLTTIEQWINVDSVQATPGSYDASSAGYSGALIGVDIAVLVLDAAAPVMPFVIRRDPPSDQVGATVTIVGFGLTETGVQGERREATTTVTSVQGNLVTLPPRACNGDSGGPLIEQDGRVIAIASIGEGACGQGAVLYNALAPALGLIDDAVSATSGAQGGPDAGAGAEAGVEPDATADQDAWVADASEDARVDASEVAHANDAAGSEGEPPASYGCDIVGSLGSASGNGLSSSSRRLAMAVVVALMTLLLRRRTSRSARPRVRR